MERSSLKILVIDKNPNGMANYGAVARNLGDNNEVDLVTDYDQAARRIRTLKPDLIIAVEDNSAAITEIDLYTGLRRQGNLTPFVYITDKPESFEEGGEEQAAIEAAFGQDERFVRVTNTGTVSEKLTALKAAVGMLTPKPSTPDGPPPPGS